jgi:hypothetical protein
VQIEDPFDLGHPNGDASLARDRLCQLFEGGVGIADKLHQDQNLDLGGKLALQALYGLVLGGGNGGIDGEV